MSGLIFVAQLKEKLRKNEFILIHRFAAEEEIPTDEDEQSFVCPGRKSACNGGLLTQLCDLRLHNPFRTIYVLRLVGSRRSAWGTESCFRGLKCRKLLTAPELLAAGRWRCCCIVCNSYYYILNLILTFLDSVIFSLCPRKVVSLTAKFIFLSGVSFSLFCSECLFWNHRLSTHCSSTQLLQTIFKQYSSEMQ